MEETTLERGRARVTGMMTWFEQGVARVSGNHLKYSFLQNISNALKLRKNRFGKTLKVLKNRPSGIRKFVPSSVSYSLFVIRCGSFIQLAQDDPG